MIETNKERLLVFVGDVHGKFRELVWKASEQYKLEHVDLVVLGDFGVGFDEVLKLDYQRALKKLEKHDIQIFTIRGNHDDPEFFEEEETEKTQALRNTCHRIHFLSDHKVYKIGRKEIYTIGGGGSTDITIRTPGKSWWEGEYIVEKPIKDLPNKVDIIISHEAPLTFEPIISRFPETPEEQYLKILKGRTYLDNVLNEVTCKNWFYGHYHQHYSGSFGSVLYRGLSELEFYQYGL